MKEIVLTKEEAGRIKERGRVSLYTGIRGDNRGFASSSRLTPSSASECLSHVPFLETLAFRPCVHSFYMHVH
jgi:hypothetical protein